MRDLPSVESEPLGAFSLADLLRDDPLGEDCIAESDIDLAFYASGKGTRLPRTCLPDPCNEALTPFRLAELIGRPAQTSEWDLYFSRYADACRKEIVDFDADAAPDEPLSPAAFWAPILGGRVVQGRLVRDPGSFVPTARRLFGPSFVGNPEFGPPLRPGTPFTPDPTPPVDNPEDGTDDTTQLPSPVPLPLSLWMLLSAMISFRVLRGSA